MTRAAGLWWSIGGRVLRWLLGSALSVAAFYALAGRWDLPWLWTTAAVASLLGLTLALSIDRDLARERRRPGPGGRDRVTQWIMALAMAAEDAYLLEHLPGYRDYATSVPARVIPGIW